MKLTIRNGDTTLIYEQEQESTKGSHLAFSDKWSGSCVTEKLMINIKDLCDKVAQIESEKYQ